MSDAADTGSVDTGSPNGGASSKFSEREIQFLAWAMQSVKSVPEIDYKTLAKFAGMSNPRSAGNAWAKIKAKLVIPDGAATATPKKGGAKKKAEDGEDGSPKKTPRKRVAKKQEVDGDIDASPKKRGRPTKRKTSDDESDLKAESDSESAAAPAADKDEGMDEGMDEEV